MGRKLLSGYLAGQCLVASPSMDDPRFQKSVIYLCSHSPEGAMGFVINKPLEKLMFADLLEQLQIRPTDEIHPQRIMFGGPVEVARGFVLHSSDYFHQHTLPLGNSVALTSTIDIIRDISEGHGPEHSILTLGYAGWMPGQLDQELKESIWLPMPADEELLFDVPIDDKWSFALSKIGVDPLHMNTQIGHA